MTEVLHNVPAAEGVRKIGRDEGEKFEFAGAHLTWKVKAHDSAYQFTVCEMVLAPGEGVPVHSHGSKTLEGIAMNQKETPIQTLQTPIEGVLISDFSGSCPAHFSLPASTSCLLIARMRNRSQVRFEIEGHNRQIEVGSGHVMVRSRSGPSSWWWSRPDYTVIVQLPLELLQRVSQSSQNAMPCSELNSYSFSQDLFLHQTVERLVSEIKNSPIVNRLYSESLIIQIATHLIRRYAQMGASGCLPSGLTPNRLRRVIEFIHGQIDQDLGLEQLAEVAGISPFYFCREFKKSTGFTPHHYVMERRIEYSKRLLETTDKSITEISAQLEFPTPSHFAATFKKFAGLTPTRYRQTPKNSGTPMTDPLRNLRFV